MHMISGGPTQTATVDVAGTASRVIRTLWALPSLLVGCRRAFGQLEVADPGLPAACGRNLIVLIHIPKCAVVRRVHIHGRVIAPAGTPRLRARPVNQDGFTQRQLTKRISLKAARVANSGKYGRCVRYAVPESRIAVSIHSDTAHPAVHPIIRCVGTLLKH